MFKNVLLNLSLFFLVNGAIVEETAFCYLSKDCDWGTKGVTKKITAEECEKLGGCGWHRVSTFGKNPCDVKCEKTFQCHIGVVRKLQTHPKKGKKSKFLTVDEDPDDQCSPPYGGGEPHFKTWAGDWYDYHGECDLMFLHAPKHDLRIHLRTTIRYAYSFVSSAAVQINGGILEVSGWGAYILNGIGQADLTDPGATLAGHKIVYTQLNDKQHTFEIDLGEDGQIVLKTFKDWVSVSIGSFSEDYFGDSVGLLGTFQNGTKVARDGITILLDDNAFGQEWQVRDTDPMLFETLRAPEYPQACRLPTPDGAQANKRRLGQKLVTLEEATGACDHWKENKDLCIYDVMASSDLEVAEAGSI